MNQKILYFVSQGILVFFTYQKQQTANKKMRCREWRNE